jgi:hypothetical protein
MIVSENKISRKRDGKKKVTNGTKKGGKAEGSQSRVQCLGRLENINLQNFIRTTKLLFKCCSGSYLCCILDK